MKKTWIWAPGADQAPGLGRLERTWKSWYPDRGWGLACLALWVYTLENLLHLDSIASTAPDYLGYLILRTSLRVTLARGLKNRSVIGYVNRNKDCWEQPLLSPYSPLFTGQYQHKTMYVQRLQINIPSCMHTIPGNSTKNISQVASKSGRTRIPTNCKSC